MSKSKGQLGLRGNVRADLETVLLDLADHEEVAPLIRLRIQQAIARGGMDALLGPALDDLARASSDVASARQRLIDTIHTRLGVR